MIKLAIAAVFAILPMIGYFMTDGVILAEMDQTLVKLMVAKIVVLSLFLVYVILHETQSTEPTRG